MRIIGLGVVVVTTLLLCTTVACADVSSTDKTDIQDQIDSIVSSVNRGDVDTILTMISPNARPTLGSEIEESIAGQSIRLRQSTTSYQDLGDNRVRVNNRYEAKVNHWSVSGYSNFFVFESHEDSWLLFDTNFHQKLGPGYIKRKFIESIIWVLLAVVVFLVLGTAWQRRSQQRAALEELREHLIGHDMITSVLAEDSPQGVPEAKTFAGKLIRFLLGGDPGYISVNGMNYDLVTVRIGSQTDRVDTYNIGGISIEKSRGSSRPVEFHYIVRTDVADARAVKARLRTKRGRRSGIVAVAWRGGRLADILNAQTELNMAIKKCFLPKDSLKLRYDRRNRAVRIVMRVRQKSVTGFFVLPLPTAETMNVINKIAGLVRQDVSGYLS